MADKKKSSGASGSWGTKDMKISNPSPVSAGVPKTPSFSYTGGNITTLSKTPKSTPSTSAGGGQPVQQPQTSGDSGAGGGFTMPEYGGYQFNFETPQIPGEYQITEEDLARFYSQATAEATQLFDPQVLSLQQTLAKNLLAAQQTGSGVNAQYEAVIKSVDEWKLQAIKDEQARWYARGMGIGGGLVQAETDVEKQAMGLKTTAGTEKAQKLSDIEAQKQLLTEQGGQSEQELVKQKAAYIATRQQEIQDAYVAHKEAIAQQTFQNQMAVQQFGMTAQAQAFDQWLQQTSMANEIWYQNKQIALAELENTQNEAYRKESLAASKSTSTTNKNENKFNIPGTSLYVTPEQAWNMGYIKSGTNISPTTTTSWQDKLAELASQRAYQNLSSQTSFGNGQYYNLSSSQGTSYYNPTTKKYEIR